MDQHYDLVILGGGINGLGTAAEAAERGLKVLLCDQGDLAGQTSSWSTKLIHGGLRYLEHYDFRLVRHALKEQQLLMANAEHLIQPLEFLIPIDKQQRPAWLLRLGLFLYDSLRPRRSLPKSRSLNAKQHPDCFTMLKPEFSRALAYFDASTDDSRLCIANALQAKAHGAKILTQSQCIHAEVKEGLWNLQLQGQDRARIKARVLINASGPWVNEVNQQLGLPIQHKISLIKGSHILVDALYPGKQAYLLQHPDQRVVFVIPYQGYSMIGTTDILQAGPLAKPETDPEEIDYLCKLVNHYFNSQLTTASVRHSFSGLRTLLQEEGKAASALSRDYCFAHSNDKAPSVTIYSGKITTYRRLAEDLISSLATYFPNLQPSASHNTPLPGSEFQQEKLDAYRKRMQISYPFLPRPLLDRYLKLYGRRMELFLGQKKSLEALGICFAVDCLYQAEVDYLVAEEWAKTAEDILWRRTKLGLSLGAEVVTKLQDYLLS